MSHPWVIKKNIIEIVPVTKGKGGQLVNLNLAGFRETKEWMVVRERFDFASLRV